ncbi:hypothetical protein GCM10009555_024240 [Acrocarpospora macrocephala]|uniref:Amidohydrolase n=1 Tax=Acrocarpospora macrocephala TaxID=150177 RepID=A0A5M3WV56_9ACTN|nr:amidohydrolase [Acrocarpospora macrocephala]GES12356.1 hypothetical protein Amac_059530 [Acrocarpospora macrocephala]
MSGLSEAQRSAVEAVDEISAELSEFHMQIWSLAEPAWREYRSARLYVDRLREEGFEVEEGSGGMPTAFAARWGDSGPAIGMYAEYDASPGYSQEPVPYRSPRAGFHPLAPGFTDAHCALGVGALAGAIATKRALERSGIPGQVRFFGEPAEKVSGSKVVHATKGYYDDLDAAISYHPFFHTCVRWDYQNAMYSAVIFTFETLPDDEWVQAPPSITSYGPQSAAKPPGALDALGLMLTATKYVKESLFPHMGLWRLNESMPNTSQATADNLPIRFTQIQYSWSSPLAELQDSILDALKRNARHAAGIAHCKVSMRWVSRTRPALVNHAMAATVNKYLHELGPATFSEEVYEHARALEAELGFEPSADPFLRSVHVITEPQEWDAIQRSKLPPWQECTGSDDYTEYSWHAPVARVFTAKPTLHAVGDIFHWANNTMNGIPAAIDPTWIYGGKTLALSALEYFENPELRKEAREEFLRRRDNADERFHSPLLPADFKPPIDLPWPEYVETARGLSWQLPTTQNFGEEL